ncbi:MAG: 4-hydroxyacetophenone monooxygenase, partial [Mycobacterium sp.]
MRNPNSGAPFMDSDDEIAAALQDVSIPTLLLSCVHMTDDESVRRAILEGPIKPAGLFLNEVQGYMSEEDKAAARTLALDIIRDYRDRGCPEP